jgi:hypothetical protein
MSCRGFTLKSREAIWISRKRLGKDLDRDFALQPRYPMREADPMEEMHSSTPFFSHGGSKSTSATSRVPRQRRRDPMRWLSLRARGEARRLDGASTRQRDTLTSRSHAATIFLARIRGRSHRSNRMSNATVRILSDDPGSVEGLAATLRSRLAIGYPCGLTTATETSRLCPPRGRHWSVSTPRPAICTRSGGVSTTSPKLRRIHVESCKLQ